MITWCLVFALNAAQSARVGFTISLAAAGCCVLWRIGQQVRNTTLVPVWRWSVVAGMAVVAVETLSPAASVQQWRFVAATVTVCPAIAMLGAKRPQSGAWQWVVLSLWIVLAMPAVEYWLRDAADVRLSRLRQAFLFGLILLSWCNAALGRYGGPATLLAIAQALLFAPHLGWTTAAWNDATAMAAIVAANVGIGWGRDFGRLSPRRPQELPQQHAWRDFRDLFGLFWSLRLAERFNVDARRAGWPERLGWTGFTATDEDADSETLLTSASPDVVRQNFANLLRRFVSTEWLAHRWPG